MRISLECICWCVCFLFFLRLFITVTEMHNSHKMKDNNKIISFSQKQQNIYYYVF